MYLIMANTTLGFRVVAAEAIPEGCVAAYELARAVYGADAFAVEAPLVDVAALEAAVAAKRRVIGKTTGRVAKGLGCPDCGERRADYLEPINEENFDDDVRCHSCGTIYTIPLAS